MTAVLQRTPEIDPNAVLAKAVVRAASLLGLTQSALGKVIGVSPATVSRMSNGGRIDVQKKEGELALLFVRLFRSLDALVGGSETAAHQWFNAENVHLGDIPATMSERPEGLVRVVEYLDAMRGR